MLGTDITLSQILSLWLQLFCFPMLIRTPPAACWFSGDIFDSFILSLTSKHWQCSVSGWLYLLKSASQGKFIGIFEELRMFL